MKEIIKDLQQGKFIILQDDAKRENEADLVIAAELINYEKLNFIIREACGFLCVAMAGEWLDRLHIPLMSHNNQSKEETAFTMTVEAASGTTTGVSIADRLQTIKTLENPKTTSADLVSPGHISPLRASEKGVFTRQGHTEGSVDLMTLSGLTPVAVICELMGHDGHMLKGEGVTDFASKYNINITTVAAVRDYRLQRENVLKKIATCKLPLRGHGVFDCHVFKDTISGSEHITLVKPYTSSRPLVRVHSKCFTGDVLHSQRCECGEQVEQSLSLIEREGGVFIYLDQEGRGIGLANKIKSYALQEKGVDTVEANHQLGLAADLREYYSAAHILKQLSIDSIELLTNSPHKIEQLSLFNIDVQRRPLQIKHGKHNINYLKTKKEKLNHLLDLEDQ